MWVVTRFKDILDGEREVATPTPVEDVIAEPVAKEKERSAVGQRFSDVGDLFGMAQDKTTSDLYATAYQKDPNTIKRVLGQPVTQFDVDASTTSIWDNAAWGIASMVYKLVKPGDYKSKMEKTEGLYNDTFSIYSQNRQQIKMLEAQRDSWNLDIIWYQNGVYAAAKEMLDYYNKTAERYGLWKMDNFVDMEKGLYVMADIYETKKMYDKDRAELSEDVFSVLTPEESPEIAAYGDWALNAYNNNLLAAMNTAAQQDFTWRTFKWVEVNPSDLTKATRDIAWKFTTEYNSFLDIRKTLMKLQEETPNGDFSPELRQLDGFMTEAEDVHKLFMKEYIKNIGKEWYQDINSFTESFKKKTWRDIAGLFSDDLGWVIRVTDVRQAQIIKDYALLKRDMNQIARGNVNPLDLISPFKRIDWKLTVQAPTALSAMSLLRWSLVTPTFKNAANTINNIFHVRQTTDFYNSGMNMLKSAAFNLDESRDYNAVDFFRKSAELAPDIAEFIIPIGKVAKAQQILWKWATQLSKVWKISAIAGEVPKISKRTSQVAKVFNTNFMSIAKPEAVLKTISRGKYWMGQQFMKGLTHTIIDMNVINAAFETRNPKEYSALDAVFDLSFNAVEVMARLGKLNSRLWTEMMVGELKENVLFQDAVFKDFLYRWDSRKLTQDQIDELWASVPEADRLAWRVWAKNFMDMWERFESYSFLLGIEPAEYITEQTTIRRIRDEASALLWRVKSDAGDLGARQNLGVLTEADMSEIVERNIKEMWSPQLLEDRQKFLDNMNRKQLDDPKVLPTNLLDDVQDGELFKAIQKFDSADANIRKSWFVDFKAELKKVDEQLIAGTWDRRALQAKRKLYIDRLDYYQKAVWELDRQVAGNVANAVDGTKSRIFGDLWYMEWLNIKKINENKKYNILERGDTTKYVVAMDWETIYPAKIDRYHYKWKGTGAWSNFYVFRTTSVDQWEQVHIQNFLKSNEWFIEERVFDTAKEAADFVRSTERLISPTESNLKFLTSAYDLPVKEVEPPIDFIKDYNDYITSRPAAKASEYINSLSDTAIIIPKKINPVPQTILKVFDGLDWSNDPNVFLKKGTVITPEVWDSFSREFSKLIRADPMHWADRVWDSAVKYDALLEKYGIDKIDLPEFIDDTFEWYPATQEFIEQSNSYKIYPDIDKTNAQRPDYVVAATEPAPDKKRFKTVMTPTQPKPNQTLQQQTVEEANKIEDGVKEWIWSLTKEWLENVQTINKIKFDYKGMDTAAKNSVWINTWGYKVSKNFFESLLPQAKDYLPNSFQDWLRAYDMANSSIKYTVDWKPLSELIPLKGTKEYVQLVEDATSAIKKTTDNDLAKASWIPWALESLTDSEASALQLWKLSQSYFNDMAATTRKYMGDYVTKPLTNPERWFDTIRSAQDFSSIFYFISKTDDNLYWLMTDPVRAWEYFAKYWEPPRVSASPSVKINKINSLITEFARQGKWNAVIRWFVKLGLGPTFVRRASNFLWGWAYIIWTTLVNPALLPSQLFLNGIWLTTDAIFKQNKRGLWSMFSKNFRKNSDIDGLMKKFWLLYDWDNVDLIPRSTNVNEIWKQLSDPKYWKAISKFWKNVLNAGMYNFTEMAFDKSFKMQRITETLVADRGIRNIDEFNNFMSAKTIWQQQDFLSRVNEKSIARYVQKTWNSFNDLEKFHFWNTKTAIGNLTKYWMRAISLLANWGYTHVRSFSDLISWYNLNRIALNNFENGKWTLRQSKQIVENLLNSNYDYENIVNKFFFTTTVGRKLDRISDNDIEEDSFSTKAWDTLNYAKYLYAPFAWPESSPVIRLIAQTFGSAILAGKHNELDINAVEAAGTTFLTRIFGEAKRRFVAPASFARGISVVAAEEDLDWVGDVLIQTYNAWKEATAWFWYFIDRDINYYGYEPEMPVTANSELSLFIPEWNKTKTEFMKLNALEQMAQLQNTDKTYRDYFKYRLPVWRDVLIGKFGKTTNTTAVNHYVVNNDKRWNELKEGDLNLNWDREAWNYVFDQLIKYAAQPFNDNRQKEGTKIFMRDMTKEYNFFPKDSAEVVNLWVESNKEERRVKNMFELADEEKMWAFFSEFTKADNNWQKQWLHLLAFIEAQLEAEGKGESIPGAKRLLVSSVAQDMYYRMSNQVKKEKWYARWSWYLSDIDPQADADIKYYIADQLWDTLYDNDKNAWTSIGRYYARDQAIEDWDPIESLFSSKYVVDKDTGKPKLKYWDVKVLRDLKADEGNDAANTLATNFNDLYLLSNIMVAENKLNPDRFYVWLSSILVPKSQKEMSDPAYVNIALTMTKIIAETIDNGISPTEEKSAAKAWLAAALFPMLNKVTPDVVEAIGEDKYRQLQDWMEWTNSDIKQQDLDFANKTLQDADYNKPTEPTDTLIDMYDKNGNYSNTSWSKWSTWWYDYASSLNKYAQTYWNKLPNTSIKISSTYWKTAYAKNLYLKFVDAKSQSIPWWAWRGVWPTTGFTLKWGKVISLKTLPVKAVTLDEWLIRRSLRSINYPAIAGTQYVERWRE